MRSSSKRVWLCVKSLNKTEKQYLPSNSRYNPKSHQWGWADCVMAEEKHRSEPLGYDDRVTQLSTYYDQLIIWSVGYPRLFPCGRTAPLEFSVSHLSATSLATLHRILVSDGLRYCLPRGHQNLDRMVVTPEEIYKHVMHRRVDTQIISPCCRCI